MAEGAALRVRPAREADRDFLVETIIEAEKSGSQLISYCEIFSLSESELRGLLGSILAEDFEGQELCTSGYLVGELGDELAGAACGWIEGEAGLPSTLIKANLLQHFLDSDRLRAARPHLDRLAELAIEREPGAIQLESIYCRPDHRGRGVTARILSEHLARLGARASAPSKAQIILMKGNAQAHRAYRKLGFEVTRERRAQDPALASIVPGDTKILMEKSL